MKTKKCIAMILAGGRGERLGALTHYYSKPAIYFGSRHRLIDFTLSNCKNSGIDVAGILSQYFTADLNEYINYAYGGKSGSCGIHLLSSKSESNAYKGTADSVYRNFSFIEQYMPEYVLILASDHVYRMDYNKLIAFHEEKGADVTIASTTVPLEDASRFGIISAGEDGRIFGFEEKPGKPKSRLASMGVYIFNRGLLKKYLTDDSIREESNHDFGKDILPEMLFRRRRLYTYQFDGYWCDVGTVDKLWEASMAQLNGDFEVQMTYSEWSGKHSSMSIPAAAKPKTVNLFSKNTVVIQSILSEEYPVYGNIGHSVLGDSVTVGRGSEIVNSIIMPNVSIGRNVKIHNSIIGNHTIIRDGVVIGKEHGTDFFVDYKMCSGDVSLVSPWVEINENVEIRKNSHVIKENLNEYYSSAKQRTDFKSQTAEYAFV